jgi:hypothetical protein
MHAHRAAWAIIDTLRRRTSDPALRSGLTATPLVGDVEALAHP